MSELKKFLNDEFANRKQKNGRYSKKAFSRDMGISATALNDFLSGRRDLNFRNIDKVFNYLNKKIYCSWCDKPQKATKLLIGGPRRQFICDGCVEKCNEIIRTRRIMPN